MTPWDLFRSLSRREQIALLLASLLVAFGSWVVLVGWLVVGG